METGSGSGLELIAELAVPPTLDRHGRLQIMPTKKQERDLMSRCTDADAPLLVEVRYCLNGDENAQTFEGGATLIRNDRLRYRIVPGEKELLRDYLRQQEYRERALTGKVREAVKVAVYSGKKGAL